MNAAPLPQADGATPVKVLHYISPAQAAAALTARVVADLDSAIRLRGGASIAVPGGTTPGPFLTLLGQRNLDWRQVTLTLTDERWVPPTHERSNAGLVDRTFARGAHGYHWFGLWREGIACESAPAILDRESRDLPWPIDVVVLGMGDDGHVASLFPGDEAGFKAADAARYVAVLGPGDEPRISLRADALVAARAVYVLVNGPRKLAVLDELADSQLPVARVLRARRATTHVYAGP